MPSALLERYLTDDLWFDVTRQVQNELLGHRLRASRISSPESTLGRLGFMKANLKLAFECRCTAFGAVRAQVCGLPGGG